MLKCNIADDRLSSNANAAAYKASSATTHLGRALQFPDKCMPQG